MLAQPTARHGDHVTIDPAILYFGTPVVLISTVNEDGSFNLAPMSSAWWIGKRCLLGLDGTSQTTLNLVRTGECVLNLPSAEMVAAVDRLARTTGSDPVPARKIARGYRHERDKFGLAGLTPSAAQTVAAPRAQECPVHLEGRVAAIHELNAGPLPRPGTSKAIELCIERVHVAPFILYEGGANRIDPDKWRPLIMSFQQFYGLTPARLQQSTLASIPEALYRP